MAGDQRLKLHIKNNRSGEDVFRMTPERVAEALARAPDIAGRVDTFIDWDFDNFEESIATADGLITWELPTENLRARAPKLKWIHIIGAGIEHMLPLDWLPRGVTLTNNRGVHAPKSGEYGAMAILMLNNHMPAMYTRQRAGNFDPIFATPVVGKTLVVIGCGKMGGAVARAARKLGLYVIGVRRHGKPARFAHEVHGPEAIDDLLVRADFVLVTTPLVRDTENLMDARRLDLLKPTAGLINMSRARVVDYGHLSKKLTEGSLSGAVLDVFDPEPLPSESPLWHVPNLIATPHISSDDDLSYTPLTLDLFLDNARRVLAGKPLRNRVSPKLGY